MAAGGSHHELKHIALGQAVGEITLAIGSYHFQLVTTCNQLIRNFYKAIIQRLDVKRFGLNTTSRIKAFVFSFVSSLYQQSGSGHQVALWGKGIL